MGSTYRFKERQCVFKERLGSKCPVKLGESVPARLVTGVLSPTAESGIRYTASCPVCDSTVSVIKDED